MNQRRTLAFLALATVAAPASAQYLTGFESPPFNAATVNLQDGWTSADPNAFVRTASDIQSRLTAAGLSADNPVHRGDQALMVSGTGTGASIRTIGGMETLPVVQLDVFARPLAATGAGTGNVFLTMEDAQGDRAAAFRFGVVSGNRTIDYGTNVSGFWQPTGLTWDPNSWYRITLTADYTSQTYDIAVNGTKVNVNPITFYSLNSTDFRQLRVFRGSNQAGMIVDDLRVSAPVPEPASLAALALGVGGLLRRRRAR